MSRALKQPNVVVLARVWQARALRRNRLSLRDSRLGWFVGVWLLAACVGIVLCVWTYVHGTVLTTLMLGYPLMLTGICATPACYIAMRARRRQSLEFAQSFLAALPISHQQIRAATARSVAAETLVCLTVCALPVCIALVAAGGDVRVFTSILACVGFGVIAGSLLGWRLALRATSGVTRRPGNDLRWQVRFARRSGRQALGHWPMLQARRSTDPGFHARVLLPVLLSMPVGIPLPIILAIIACFALLLVAWEWLRALHAVLPAAMRWLRSLPVPALTLLMHVSLHCVVWFVAAILVAAALSLGIGVPAVVVIGFGVFAMSGLLVACAAGLHSVDP